MQIDQRFNLAEQQLQGCDSKLVSASKQGFVEFDHMSRLGIGLCWGIWAAVSIVGWMAIISLFQ